MSALKSFPKISIKWRFAACVVLLSVTAAFSFRPSLEGQGAPETSAKEGNCSGLHAGIRAEFVPLNPPYTTPAYVMVIRVLLNDGDTPADTAPGSWKVVIDGKQLDDLNIGNGLGPVGGYGTLNPGDTYQLRADLPVSRYFPEAREYKVSWRGKAFQSPTITVKIPVNLK
jgi:hypothetical protein